MIRHAATLFAAAVLGGCSPPAPHPPAAEAPHRLPTGAILDPAAPGIDIGSFPLAIAVAPGGTEVVALLNGYGQQGVQVIDLPSRAVRQVVEQPSAFLGLVFDHAGRRLYASGGNQDAVYRYAWRGGGAEPLGAIQLAAPADTGHGRRYPGGLATTADDRWLLVAENLSDSLALIDLASGKLRQRLPAGRYPYGVVAAQDGSIYVSAWGGWTVSTFRLRGDSLEATGEIPVGRHPSALLLSANGERLFVALASTDRVSVIDTRHRRVIAQLVDSVPGSPAEGSTPNALALSPDGRRLHVAEADNNAVATFLLAPATAGVGGGAGTDRLLGRVPVDWYPSALAAVGETLLVANGKGHGSGPNATDGPGRPAASSRGYTLGQLSGTLSLLPPALLDSGALASLSARVARANGWGTHPEASVYPPFEHVIYVIKENRTYDQVLGDLAIGDGDTALTYFPRTVTPNHHALAERFGVYDRFFVNAEVSADGHNWATAAYATDYVEKTTPSNYSSRGRSYDYEGENRNTRPPEGEDAAEPAAGYLWDLARRRHLSFRNFGEFVRRTDSDHGALPPAYVGLKPFLEEHTDSGFPGFDLEIPDQLRADRWIAALDAWSAAGVMPTLQILRLPNDHTMGARADALTPRAYLADNDLALGRVIEAVTRSPFWRSTLVLVVEDDAQNGPDHVDSHRAPFLLISAWSRPRVWHRFVNTTDVMATIEDVLSLDHLSQFDAFGRPLRGVFAATPDLTPYSARPAEVPLVERNPPGGPGARESLQFDFRYEDLADDDRFNRVLWLAIKGDRISYPGGHSRTPLQWRRGE
jgi:DNA-binding beta-propeller fold protein YncE